MLGGCLLHLLFLGFHARDIGGITSSHLTKHTIINHNIHISTRVYDAIFSDSFTARSGINCIGQCLQRGSDTLFDRGSKRCSCTPICFGAFTNGTGTKIVAFYRTTQGIGLCNCTYCHNYCTYNKLVV